MRGSLVVKTQESFHVKVIAFTKKVSCTRLHVVRDAVFMVESSLEKSKELALSFMTVSQGLCFFICKSWVIIPSCPFLKDIFCKNIFISLIFYFF